MPCICEFNGLKVYIYGKDHGFPHLHCMYAGQQVKIDIHTLEVIAGSIPAKKLKEVQEWMQEHREELLEDWDLVKAGKIPRKIAPP